MFIAATIDYSDEVSSKLEGVTWELLCHSGAGRLGTLKYNSFRWRSIRMFNRLSKAICMLSSCSVVGFKSQLDSYLKNLVDLPWRP